MNIPLMKNPSIRNSSDYEDRNGLLGKKILTAGVVENVYTVSDKSKYVTANFNIVNTTTVSVEVRLWVTTEKIPTDVDIIESKIVLEPDAVYIRTTFIMDKLETVFALANIDGVVMRIDGYDDRPT